MVTNHCMVQAKIVFTLEFKMHNAVRDLGCIRPTFSNPFQQTSYYAEAATAMQQGEGVNLKWELNSKLYMCGENTQYVIANILMLLLNTF